MRQATATKTSMKLPCNPRFLLVARKSLFFFLLLGVWAVTQKKSLRILCCMVKQSYTGTMTLFLYFFPSAQVVSLTWCKVLERFISGTRLHHKTAKCSVRASIVKTTYLFPPAVIYLVVWLCPETSPHIQALTSEVGGAREQQGHSTAQKRRQWHQILTLMKSDTAWKEELGSGWVAKQLGVCIMVKQLIQSVVNEICQLDADWYQLSHQLMWAGIVIS